MNSTEIFNLSHRPYHNIQHIQEIKDVLDSLGLMSEDMIVLAEYHDLIYEPMSSMNEQLSAQICSGLFPARAEYYTKAILATTKHKKTDDKSINHFLDADMWILASDPCRYAEYAKAIRKEYCMVNDVDYAEGRVKFLESFSGFITEEFHPFNDKAFENVENEISFHRKFLSASYRA